MEYGAMMKTNNCCFRKTSSPLLLRPGQPARHACRTTPNLMHAAVGATECGIPVDRLFPYNIFMQHMDTERETHTRHTQTQTHTDTTHTNTQRQTHRHRERERERDTERGNP